jgi:hypothetical protein
MTRDFYIKNVWRWAAGVPEITDRPTLAELERTEWSPDFERHMRIRLLLGSMRYGLLGSTCKPHYDRVQGIKDRIDEYKKTGNLDLLVDVANFALLEFVEGRHPNRHMASAAEAKHVEMIR